MASGWDATAMPPAEELAALFRRNLDRNYGCKVFFVGAPVMGIRLPQQRASMITAEDSARIKSILEVQKSAIKAGVVAKVILLSDETFVEIDPEELQDLAFSGNAGEEEEGKEEEDSSYDLADILTDFARSETRTASKSPKSGRRAEVLAEGKRGRYVRARMPRGKTTDVALAPTIRAALARSGGNLVIREEDLREKVRRRKVATLIGIVLDSSFSMEESARATRKVVIELLKDAYARRDRVALVSCSGRRAEVVLPFTSAVVTAKRHLEKIEYGGTTPLASGLATGLSLLKREQEKEPSATPIMVLITDGSANVPLEVAGDAAAEAEEVARDLKRSGIHLLVVDVGAEGSDLARSISFTAGGRYVKTSRPSKEEIYAAIKGEQMEASAFGSADGRA
ncbi:MAG TPA: VWA domain-containing protein [Methanothrix sp.]|nr:VWA domain-containing protein [Methanothrix sp.]HPR67606.1 VWA domain-containing protein [Methanothrix sp.]